MNGSLASPPGLAPIVVEGFQCSSNPRSSIVWGFIPLVVSPMANRSWGRDQTKLRPKDPLWWKPYLDLKLPCLDLGYWGPLLEPGLGAGHNSQGPLPMGYGRAQPKDKTWPQINDWLCTCVVGFAAACPGHLGWREGWSFQLTSTWWWAGSGGGGGCWWDNTFGSAGNAWQSPQSEGSSMPTSGRASSMSQRRRRTWSPNGPCSMLPLSRQWRSNVVFALEVKEWTSSTPPAGSSRVPGSLPNQSTCVLWIWKQHANASLEEYSGGVFGIMGCPAPLMWAVHSLYEVRVWSISPAISRSGSQWRLDPARAALYHQFCL